MATAQSAAPAPDPEDSPGSEADYAAILNAVMETARGRWFLAEFTRRNRNADTEALQASLARIEARLEETAAPAVDAAVGDQVAALVTVVDRSRRDFAEIEPDPLDPLARKTAALLRDIAERLSPVARAYGLPTAPEPLALASPRIEDHAPAAPEPPSARPAQPSVPQRPRMAIDFAKLGYEQKVALFS